MIQRCHLGNLLKFGLPILLPSPTVFYLDLLPAARGCLQPPTTARVPFWATQSFSTRCSAISVCYPTAMFVARKILGSVPTARVLPDDRPTCLLGGSCNPCSLSSHPHDGPFDLLSTLAQPAALSSGDCSTHGCSSPLLSRGLL
jgi:hypothetical protein